MNVKDPFKNEHSLDPENLLRTGEAALLLDISPGTLQNWRSEGKGPSFHKHEGRVYYLRSIIEEYKKRNFLKFASTKEWKEHK